MSDLDKAGEIRIEAVQLLAHMREQARSLRTLVSSPQGIQQADLLVKCIELLWDRFATDVTSMSVMLTVTVADDIERIKEQIRASLPPEDKAE